MKHKNKVIFDLDGVLLDSETNLDWLDRALKRALKELGIQITPENLSTLYPGGLQDFETSVKDLSVPAEKIWRIRDKHYVKEKLNMIRKGSLGPFSDVDHLEKLLPAYTLAVISNSPREVVDTFVRTYNMENVFDAWTGRGSRLESLKKIKPHPHLFTKLKEKIGDGQFWYVGDREVDRKFAENTGMEFLHLTRNREGFKDLEELVDYLL